MPSPLWLSVYLDTETWSTNKHVTATSMCNSLHKSGFVIVILYALIETLE